MAPSPPQLSPLKPAWQPPSLEEFEADIERRRLQPVLYECRDILGSLTNFLAEIGQGKDPMKHGTWLSLQADCLLPALQEWHGIIPLEIRKLSCTLKDLHKSMFKILFPSLRMRPDSVLTVSSGGFRCLDRTQPAQETATLIEDTM